MSKKRKAIAPDSKTPASSVSRQKIEATLGDKLKAAGIVDVVPNREESVAKRVERDSSPVHDRKSKPDTRQADRDELSRAYLGVQRLRNQRKKRVRKREPSIGVVETGCEQNFDGLVRTSEVNLLASPDFEINWDRDGDVTALRRDVEVDELSSLFGGRFKPEATLDLHGTVSKDLEREVARFVLYQYRRGIRRLLLVHGKGKHSDDGVGVLADLLVKVLTQSRVSHYVRGFCTASLEHGGSGALAVMLIS